MPLISNHPCLIRIEALHKNHKRSQFDCGNIHLNRYLQQTARQHADKGIARTFVLIEENHRSDILGFFTLMVCEIRVEELPAEFAKKYPPVAPAAKLARLAVSKRRQKQGLGQLMMIQAMQRVLNVSEQVGVIGLLVDAKDETATHYYQQYGFIPFPSQPLKLFLPLETLRNALLVKKNSPRM